MGASPVNDTGSLGKLQTQANVVKTEKSVTNQLKKYKGLSKKEQICVLWCASSRFKSPWSGPNELACLWRSVHLLAFVLDGDLSRQEMGLWRRVCEAAGPDVAAFDPHAVSTPPPGATPSVGLTLLRR